MASEPQRLVNEPKAVSNVREALAATGAYAPLHFGRQMLADLLAAYDQRVIDLDAFGHAVSDQAHRVGRLEADRASLSTHADHLAHYLTCQSKRAREAEAAVQQVLEFAERQYVAALNAILASPAENADVHRWRGHAEAWRQTAEQCCRAANMTVPAYRSDEWREAHGVYTPEQIARWNQGPAGQPAGLAGEVAGPDFRVMPLEIPLSAIPGMEDGDKATVTGQVNCVHTRKNSAAADRAWLVLVDDENPDVGWPVLVSPEGWQRYRHHLTEGATITCAIAASRDEAEMTLWLTAAATLDWDTIPAADLTAEAGA